MYIGSLYYANYMFQSLLKCVILRLKLLANLRLSPNFHSHFEMLWSQNSSPSSQICALDTRLSVE